MKYRIKEIREKKGMTQEELAETAGVAKSMIVELENAAKFSPTMKKLKCIADALGVKVKSLFFEE